VGGSILDARNDGAGDDEANILGRSVYPGRQRRGASIGSPGNDLEIDSGAGRMATPGYVGLEATNVSI
jgi:hypothetical protein